MKKILLTLLATILLISCGNSSEKSNGDLTEKERKEIFLKLNNVEKKAKEIADKEFPVDVNSPNFKQENIDKNINKDSELIEQFHSDVRKEFNIDEDTQWEIIEEGVNKGWLLN